MGHSEIMMTLTSQSMSTLTYGHPRLAQTDEQHVCGSYPALLLKLSLNRDFKLGYISYLRP